MVSDDDAKMTIADAIRIVESADVHHYVETRDPLGFASKLRVPREQTPPPAEERPSCARRNCGHVYIAHRTSDGHCVIEGCGCSVYLEMFPPPAPASAEPKCTCKCRWESHAGYASIEQVDPACPLHGKGMPAQGGAQDAEAAEDEAHQIACMLWDGRMLPDHAAAAIRALVRREREAERKRAAGVCRGYAKREREAYAPLTAVEALSQCADAIEREGGKGR